MAFQLRFASKQHIYGPLTYVSAGNDSVFTCRGVVTMTATVIGDLRGHTFEWVQIEGDPVEYLTPPDQMEMTFTFQIKDDKKFRFYVDRGTSLERFEEVWAYQTPTETHYFATMITKTSHTTNRYNNANRDNSAAHVITEFVDYSTALQGYASGTDTNKAIFWTLPTDNKNITHYVIQRWENGGWADVYLVPAGTRYVSIDNGYNYKVVTFMLDPLMYGSKYYVTESPIMKVTTEPEMFGESGSHSGYAFVPSGSAHLSTGYSVLERFLISATPDNSDSPSSNSYIPKDSHKSTGYSVMERVVKRFEPPSSDSPSNNAYVSAAGHEITTFSVIDLINIEIGSVIQIGG